MTITLSEEQQLIADKLIHWFGNTASKAKSLGGLAGTGKTTLIKYLVSKLEDQGYKVAVASFTGKAVHVLRSKGISQAITLHNFLYTAIKDPTTHTWTFVPKPSESLACDILIVDEASMVSKELHKDINHHEDLRVIYVGDHGQLEPVGANPRLMDLPDFKLETVHRQALNSPIIAFAHCLRNGFTPSAIASKNMVPQSEALSILHRSNGNFDATFQILTAFNPSRLKVNDIVRRRLGYSPELLVVGEKVICTRNNRHQNVFNGMMGTITKITHHQHPTHPNYFMVVDLLIDDGTTREDIPIIPAAFNYIAPKGEDASLIRIPYSPDFKHFLFAQFDYGYAITVHKSQGSEWDKVVVFEEPCKLWDMNRWRYTASTRAAKTLQYLTP